MSKNVVHLPFYPRAVASKPNPLGLYLRPSRRDHKQIMDVMAAGVCSCFGMVLDPTLMHWHRELADQVLRQGWDLILDPRSQQSALPGGFNEGLGRLPWGTGRAHVRSDFAGSSREKLITKLGEFVLRNGFTQVLAPTHILRSADDPWLKLDCDSAVSLRKYLDDSGGSKIRVAYPIAISYRAFCDPEQRRWLVNAIEDLPVESVWLSVETFGSASSATAVKNYLDAASDFHGLGKPIIADHVGGAVGLGLLAFGATGGITHGITQGESFTTGHLQKPADGGGFNPPTRVYFPSLNLLLSRDKANLLLESSPNARVKFGCRDTQCCPSGIRDMVDTPVRHFLYQRVREITELSNIPEQIRPQVFLERFLRPASDAAANVAEIDWQDEKMQKRTQAHRNHLRRLRESLGKLVASGVSRTFAPTPKSRPMRQVRG